MDKAKTKRLMNEKKLRCLRTVAVINLLGRCLGAISSYIGNKSDHLGRYVSDFGQNIYQRCFGQTGRDSFTHTPSPGQFSILSKSGKVLWIEEHQGVSGMEENVHLISGWGLILAP